MDSGLPSQSTRFFGRKAEIADCIALLNDPACRLLTLVGPGGIGKTRLAVEITMRMIRQFADGAYFVPLQALREAEGLAPAIVDALHVQVSNRADTQVQLLDYLRGKQLLLVLDNFEHVLAAADLLTTILKSAAEVKILVTSRESLRLRIEWLRQIHGLSYPDSLPEPGEAKFSAVQLFVERAQRLRGDFDAASQYAPIVQICQLVQGMPLALELAAGWVKSLTCAEIASEIQRDLNILAARSQDVPARHQSIQAVFEQSWRLLSEAEQRVLQGFAIFRGGCSREAAQQVTGASLPVLAALLDKSMLLHDPITGRYDMQELLRQFTEEQAELAEQPTETLRDLHCEYYSNAIHSLSVAQSRIGIRQIHDAIGRDFDNIRAAWHWALERGHYTAIDRLIEPTWKYAAERGNCIDAQDLYEATRDKLTQDPHPTEQALLGRIYARLAKCYAGPMRWSQSAEASRLAISIARAEARPDDMQYAMPFLAISLWHMDQPQEATRIMSESVALSRENGNLLPLDLCRLAHFVAGAGHVDECQTLLDEALALAQQLDDSFGTAWPDMFLGIWAVRRGNWHEAEHYLNRSAQQFKDTRHDKAWLTIYNQQAVLALAMGQLSVAEQIASAALQLAKQTEIMSNVENQVVALCTLSLLASASENHAAAHELATEALTIAERLGDIFFIAQAHFTLGWALMASDQPDDALIQLRESFEPALLWQATGDLMFHIAAFVPLLIHLGKLNQSAELLAMVLSHPQSPCAYLQLHPGIIGVRADLERRLPQADFDEAWERGSKLDVEAAARKAYDELTAANQEVNLRANQALPEPLTQRELEVLALLGNGLSNPQIAARLFIEVSTVKWYNNHIYSKLAVANRMQAVARAQELQLL